MKPAGQGYLISILCKIGQTGSCEGMNECMHEWMNEWINACMHACMHEWMNELMHACMNEWINKRQSESVRRKESVYSQIQSLLLDDWRADYT